MWFFSKSAQCPAAAWRWRALDWRNATQSFLGFLRGTRTGGGFHDAHHVVVAGHDSHRHV
jgi:hypothetical protein